MADARILEPDDLARDAVERLTETLRTGTPGLAVAAMAWMASLSAGRPEDYFTHPEAFPMLQLPWWLQESIVGAAEDGFQLDLAYSSVCGYYFVRMIDDLMDGDANPAPAAMPAMIVFHTEFEGAYRSRFAPDDAFWSAFRRFSFEAAETASVDADLDSVDLDQFLRISARKIAGAKIPIAAVCQRHDRADLLDHWCRLTDRLGRWHQMRNDVLGWASDSNRGQATYFLSEAARRAPAEPVVQWLARDGFAWARKRLDVWMDDLLAAATRLGSPALVAYLEQRRVATSTAWEQTAADLAALTRSASAINSRNR